MKSVTTLFQIKKVVLTDKDHLLTLQRELLKDGYPSDTVTSTIRFLRAAPEHPLLWDVNDPASLIHMTTCRRAKPIQLVDHYAQLIKISDTRIDGNAELAQCLFDFRGRWPKPLFRLENYESLSTIAQKAPQWLADHHELLVTNTFNLVYIDLVRYAPLLDSYTSYPLLP